MLTASQIVDKLKAAGLPINAVDAYDETSDPNKLLGRPGQYVGKANWHDSRDNNSSDTYTVEAFANASDLAARKAYVAAVTKSSSLFCEYETTHGLALLRISCSLTPTQAKAYDDALAAAIGP